MSGPLGISLANHVKQSRALTTALLPLANALARASGHRQLGLKYDDLSEVPVAKVSHIQGLTVELFP